MHKTIDNEDYEKKKNGRAAIWLLVIVIFIIISINQSSNKSSNTKYERKTENEQIPENSKPYKDTVILDDESTTNNLPYVDYKVTNTEPNNDEIQENNVQTEEANGSQIYTGGNLISTENRILLFLRNGDNVREIHRKTGVSKKRIRELKELNGL